MISNKYAKTNNPYVQSYDQDKEHNYIVYLDANNLYGWSMFRALPQSNLEWLSPDEIKQFNLSEIADDSDIVHILKVDLQIPKRPKKNKRRMSLKGLL